MKLNEKKEYDYIFSVIMSVYNTEKYLEEAILSIVNQDIDFEKNIQLILINDGSEDDSEKICLEYKNKYPNNIVYKKKENGGLASAKNLGLKYIKGFYVNFFDSDDTLPTNVFSSVYSFFKNNGLCIDFVAIPLVLFGSEEGLHPKYAGMGEKNRIISLEKEPYNFILSGASSFYKKEVFDNFRFDETFVGEEDTLLNGNLYLNNPQFGYVCENNVMYNYRKRVEQNSIVDSSKNRKESYITVIKLLEKLIKDKNKIKNWQKELIIYEIRSRLKNISLSIFDDKNEYDKILDEYRKYLRLIDKDYFIYRSYWGSNINIKNMLVSFAYGFNDSKMLPDNYLSCTLVIRKFKIENNKLLIDVTFNNYFNNDIDVYMFDQDNNIYKAYESEDFPGPFGVEYGEFILDDAHLRKFKVDLKYAKYNFILHNKINDEYYPLKNVRVVSKTGINSIGSNMYYKKYVITFTGRKIKIKKNRSNSYLSIIKRRIVEIMKIHKSYNYYPFFRLLSKRTKKYILVNDRAFKAGDNGEAIFKYINEHEQELAKNTYFVIDKKSDDYNRLKKYGKVVKLGSLKHKFLFINSKYIFSSHTMPEFYSAFDIDSLQYYKDLFDYKFVWLQHGITINDISKAANKYIKTIDYIVSATIPEFEEFHSQKYCYDKDDIILTGFPRYDYLEDDSQNIITIAPTWRRGLGVDSGVLPDFEETDYFVNWSKVIGSKKLIDYCKKSDIKIQFLLHPEMLQYEDSFKKFENDSLTILSGKDVNYSQIFKESKLFITDFSSTLFDFAYLGKPEILFQFDREFFFENHYKKGYFDYDRDAFGDILKDANDVISKIIYYIDNDFMIEKKYSKRIDDTFKYRDKNNCKRVLENTILKK